MNANKANKIIISNTRRVPFFLVRFLMNVTRGNFGEGREKKRKVDSPLKPTHSSQ